MTESTLIGHEPCEKCGSRDNKAVYSDGHSFCFGCQHYVHGDGMTTERVPATPVDTAAFFRGDPVDLIKRQIRKDTCALFGYVVTTGKNGSVQVAPYYTDGALVAQHLRDAEKRFAWVGQPKGCELFGQHLWRDGGKKVVITEGEIDCLTVSQIQSNKWPVVSLPNGATSAKKSLAANIEWLEKFDEVILMFDMDEPGKVAAAECAPLFTPGRCKIARLPLKDANELLLAGRGSEVIDAIWGAKEWRPDGVVSIEDILEDVLRVLPAGAPWCFPSMTEWTHGRRPGEVYGFGAGTGIGKTDFFTQQIAYDINVLGITTGVIYLEQNPRETVRRIAGKLAGRLFHVPTGYTEVELREAVSSLASAGKLFMYDHFGSNDWDLLRQRIRYMVVSLGCKHIYLDHLTALVAHAEDERKALDSLMSEMAGQAQELGHTIHYISHLATPEGKPHEEGGRVMLRHFRGSRAIGFWSHLVFGLERHQQDDDINERSVTTLRCLKDRLTGKGTGKTMRMSYDSTTGLLSEEGATSQF